MKRTDDSCYETEYEGFDHQISAHPKDATDILSIFDYLILVLFKVRTFI